MKANLPKIDGYTLIRQLGQGGMGTVYLGQRDRDTKSVAIKFIRQDSRTDDEHAAHARFRREIKVCATFAHPYVTKIFDGGVQGDGSLYLVMEYIEGQSLCDKVTAGLLSEEECVLLARQMGEALSYVHAKDIIHRDIKPANIVYLSTERSVLVDFGLAFPIDMTRLTETGNVVGTLHTMPPEQLQGKELTATADIYSLGVTLYYCTTGLYPYDEEKILSMAAGLTFSDLPWAGDVRQDLSSGFCKFLQKCISPDRKKRFQSATEFVEALNWGQVEDKVVEPEILVVEHKMPHRKVGALTFLLFLLLALPISGLVFRNWRKEARARQLANIRLQIVEAGGLPSVELCKVFGSLMVENGEVAPTPRVEIEAIGLAELLFEALQEERNSMSSDLALLFIKRHSSSWFASGRSLPLEEIAVASARQGKDLDLAVAAREQMNRADSLALKMAMLPMLHELTSRLARPSSLSAHWKELQKEAEKICALIEPLIDSAQSPKARQLVVETLFYAHRMDLRQEAREKSLQLLKKLIANEYTVDKLGPTLIIGVSSMVKSPPDDYGSVPTFFRREAVSFLTKALAMLQDRNDRLDCLFRLVDQSNDIGQQKEALKLLRDNPIKEDDDPHYKRFYYVKRGSVLKTVGLFDEAIRDYERACALAETSSERKRLKDIVLHIRSLALVRSYAGK